MIKNHNMKLDSVEQEKKYGVIGIYVVKKDE